MVNWRLGILILCALVILVLGLLTPARQYFSGEGLQQLQEWVRSLGGWAPMAYIGLYVSATVLALPGSALSLIAPVLFGPVTAFFIVVFASNLGANAAFVVARFLGKEAAEKLLRGKLGKATLKLDRHGFQYVLFVRLVPLFPFNALNYLCGLSPLKWWHYALGTLLGMLPGTFVYISVGNVVNQAGGQFWSWENLIRPVVWGPFVLVMLLSFLPRLLKNR